MLVSPPTTRSLLQNIAIGTRTVHYPCGRYLRITIIWSDWCDAMQANRSTLYLYELSQETIFQSFASSEDSSFRKIRRIYGRRMQSLPPALGGTHPCNLVSPIESDAASSGHQSAHLSGILLNDQKCFVRGPATRRPLTRTLYAKPLISRLTIKRETNRTQYLPWSKPQSVPAHCMIWPFMWSSPIRPHSVTTLLSRIGFIC